MARVRARARRRRRWLAAGLGMAVVVVSALGLFLERGQSQEDGPLLASTATDAWGEQVDGVSCETREQLAYHVHAHIAVLVEGHPRAIPAGIGIPEGQVYPAGGGPVVSGGSCIYWLHTHATDGIIHIESPVERTYTLGQFFDIWGQPLGSDRVGPASGLVTTYVDGKPWRASPRDVPLTPHAVIQLDVGRVVAPKTFRFPQGL